MCDARATRTHAAGRNQMGSADGPWAGHALGQIVR